MSDAATPPPAPMSDAAIPAAAASRPSRDDQAVVAFLLESVKDIQGTIRAIDTKVSILLAALSIPLKSVADTIGTWSSAGRPITLSGAIAFAAILAYGLAAAVAVRTLSGIGDATRHVEGARRHTAFYAGGLFAFSWPDAVFNRTSVRARRDVDDYVRDVPRTVDDVVVELTSEIMSLAYIRDLKALRQRASYRLTVIAAFVALLALVV